MTSFTLDGETYEYLRPDPGHPAEETRSWEYGNYPKVMASVPLNGGTVRVYAVAERWNPSYILVPAGNLAASPTPTGASNTTADALTSSVASVGATASPGSCQRRSDWRQSSWQSGRSSDGRRLR
jgi:hypothetical protein